MSKVRKIEPIAKLPETAIKPNITRVAVYARVSTDMEEQASSFEAQKDYYEKKVRENKDWTLIGIYADEGKTGTSYINRTEFLRMMEDCRLGKIDMILIKSVSRFARNTVDALNNIRELKTRNIGVLFERENIWTLDAKGEFLITLLTSLAQEESRSISENTSWGKRKAFADGRYSVAYTRFLGYDRGAKKGEFVINEGQARIVRLIYRMSLQGYSPYRISQFLTRWEVRTPTGSSKWYSSSVMSILQNEKYKGDALLQKCFTKDFLTHKRVQNNGELPQYYVHDGHEAIINREVFDYVQTLIVARNKDANGRYSGVHLYSSLFRCGKCGAYYGTKPEHSNDKYRRTILMCHNRFKTPYYCKNTRIDLRQIPSICIKTVNKIVRKYPQILSVSKDLVKELGIDADITINSAYSIDMQDISMVVKSATVYPENKIKIVLIDGTHMTVYIDENKRRKKKQKKKEVKHNIKDKSTNSSIGYCKCCGVPVKQNLGRKEKKFCSDSCRNKWWNSHLDLVKKQAVYEFTCQYCKKTFTAYGNENRKYCSHECYIAGRFGKEKQRE